MVAYGRKRCPSAKLSRRRSYIRVGGILTRAAATPTRIAVGVEQVAAAMVRAACARVIAEGRGSFQGRNKRADGNEVRIDCVNLVLQATSLFSFAGYLR